MSAYDPDTLMKDIERAHRGDAIEILSWGPVTQCFSRGWAIFRVVFKTNAIMTPKTADKLSIHISLNYPNHKIHNLQIIDQSTVKISYSFSQNK